MCIYINGPDLRVINLCPCVKTRRDQKARHYISQLLIFHKHLLLLNSKYHRSRTITSYASSRRCSGFEKNILRDYLKLVCDLSFLDSRIPPTRNQKWFINKEPSRVLKDHEFKLN